MRGGVHVRASRPRRGDREQPRADARSPDFGAREADFESHARRSAGEVHHAAALRESVGVGQRDRRRAVQEAEHPRPRGPIRTRRCRRSGRPAVLGAAREAHEDGLPFTLRVLSTLSRASRRGRLPEDRDDELSAVLRDETVRRVTNLARLHHVRLDRASRPAPAPGKAARARGGSERRPEHRREARGRSGRGAEDMRDVRARS